METIKNELKKTTEMWTNKDVWKQRLKNLFYLIVAAGIVVTILPMPTRCQVEDRFDPYITVSSPPGPLPPGVKPYVPHSIFRDCYLPYSEEFWQNPGWSFEFHWLFVKRLDLLTGYHPGYITTHLSYPANLENENILVGAAHNIFVGRVVEQTGDKVTQIGPRTQYAVEVVLSVKGSLNGLVTVDMMGGYEDGKLVMVENDDPDNFLLKPGATYLFVTRYNEQENWHTLIAHPNAKKVLSEDANANMDDLRIVAEKDEKVQRLENVYPDEALIGADIANNNTRNSFQSLPPEAKVAAVARADAARAALDARAEM